MHPDHLNQVRCILDCMRITYNERVTINTGGGWVYVHEFSERGYNTKTVGDQWNLAPQTKIGYISQICTNLSRISGDIQIPRV